MFKCEIFAQTRGIQSVVEREEVEVGDEVEGPTAVDEEAAEPDDREPAPSPVKYDEDDRSVVADTLTAAEERGDTETSGPVEVDEAPAAAADDRDGRETDPEPDPEPDRIPGTEDDEDHRAVAADTLVAASE